MNQEYDQHIQAEEAKRQEAPTPREETRFVPREPQPSQWPMAEKKIVITRGEQLFIYVLSSFFAVALLLAVVFFASTASGWTAESPTEKENPVETTTPDETAKTPEETVKTPEINKGPFADGKKGNVLYGDGTGLKSIDLSGMSPTHAVLADVSAGKLIAASQGGADQRVYPASLTKVMTMIVVVEHVRSEAALQEIITIKKETVEAMQKAEASGIGLAEGEQLTVEALLYALMLRSDGVAACELANYVAGSEEAFVAMMNRKAAAMGLTGTHFTNATGLHHPDHYATCRDLATLMGYAVNMSLCRKIMTETAFDAPCTQANGNTFLYHIYHNLLETLFKELKAIKPEQAGQLTLLAGKTGWTEESDFCLVTCAQAPDGSYYVCVTVGADSYESSIKAYQKIYSQYVTE